MKVIALRQLCGEYGLAATGQEINTSDDTAKLLLKNGVVCLPEDYQKKVVKPKEKKSSKRGTNAAAAAALPNAAPPAAGPQGGGNIEGQGDDKQE